MSGTVAFILKGYPRLSETFIAQEIAALERLGLAIRIVSLRHPTDRHRHPVHEEIRAPVRYLPEYLYQEPRRLWRAWRKVRRWPAYRATFAAWLRDLRRDPTPNRGRRFGQALVLASEIEPDTEWLHAHFMHTPASVARYAAMLTGLPYSISAHAKDIWTSPEWEKREKLADCRWLVTCTRQNRDHLASLGGAAKVELAYHGLDLDRFPPPPARAAAAPGAPLVILSVGRAVAKKGYDVLLAALAELPAGLDWRFVHIGGGELQKKLKAQAAAAGLAPRIEWLGARPQKEVLDWLRRADIFVLACRRAGDGDQDGLPNVLMEAQSQGLPCVSTRFAAVPELIRDGETGLLAEPGDVAGLAQAMARLLADAQLRQRLGAAGEARVRAEFGMAAGIRQLAERFGLAPDTGGLAAAETDRACASPSMPR
ncbi:MAG: glycosyltransferase family 4 protein [Alphaproteobacteria bacterium]|nr:glycosyltransferase family 4 protein [Alphaproteobacteria bacterium]